jgi:succinate dehydrogenase/fumarate reductase cytochrome b subunit
MPLLTNRFLLYDAAKVMAGASVLFFALVLLFAGGSVAVTILKLLGSCLSVVLVLFVVVALVVFRNAYRVRYLLSPAGILYETVDRRGRSAGTIAVIVGALTGNPGLLGSGLLTAARQSGLVEWSRARKVKSYPREGAITVMNRWRVIARIFCPKEVYAEALEWVRQCTSSVTSSEFR